jgi:hypothetical protein
MGLPILAHVLIGDARWCVTYTADYLSYNGNALGRVFQGINYLSFFSRREFGEVFGPPRPSAFDPRSRTADAIGVARAMYDARDFAAIPVLMDALLDAGCDDADILDHCRDTGPHVRGCWVVDLVLGKS